MYVRHLLIAFPVLRSMVGQWMMTPVTANQQCLYDNYRPNVTLLLEAGSIKEVNLGYSFLPCDHWADDKEPYVLDLSKVQFSSASQNAVVDIVIGNKGFIPVDWDMSCCTGYQCCTGKEKSISGDQVCEIGQLGVKETPNDVYHYTLNIQNGTTTHLNVDPVLLEGGHMWMIVSNCHNATSAPSVKVQGELQLNLLHGHLSQSAFRSFQLVVVATILYTVLIIWFSKRVWKYSRTCLCMHWLMLFVVGLGWMEAVASVLQIGGQYHGVLRSRSLYFTAAFIGASKASLARCVGLLLCAGQGTAQITVSRCAMYTSLLFGVVYFMQCTRLVIAHMLEPTHAWTVTERWHEYAESRIAQFVMNVIFFIGAFVALYNTRKRASAAGTPQQTQLRWLLAILTIALVMALVYFGVPPYTQENSYGGGPPNDPLAVGLLLFWFIFAITTVVFRPNAEDYVILGASDCEHNDPVHKREAELSIIKAVTRL